MSSSSPNRFASPSAGSEQTSTTSAAPFQPLPAAEIEKLLKLRSAPQGAEDDLGPGDVQYLRGGSTQQPVHPSATRERPTYSEPDAIANPADPRPGLSLDDLGDLELDISIELGRAELLIEDVLKLREGSVVSLDKLAGDPVDIVANGRLVARGELLVVDGKFGVRLSEVL